MPAYLREKHIFTETYTQIFLAALFITTKIGRSQICQQTSEQINCSISIQWNIQSVQSLSHVQRFAGLDCSMPGLPVRHQLPELAQTHVHRVSDAIQPSRPLSSLSPPAFNLSHHQGLF